MHQQKTVQEHKVILKQGAGMDVEEVKSRHRSVGDKKTPFNRRAKSGPITGPSKKCTRCEKEQYSWEKFPARDATCNKWHKRGHYSAQCYSISVSELHIPDDNVLDTAFLHGYSVE